MSIEKAIERIYVAMHSTNKDGFNVCNAGYWQGLIDALTILKEESITPCENCQALETKIEQMKTDHALEQLDRNMAKDRNGKGG